ncbi:ATP-binding protein [Mangrovibrevibacter kandeliae]|uniref:ATP-binding protein n=1 Tax=Mangrovibrevibacter kandeliae TaxID=2968473 RepID=UPI0021177E6A|nr:ATP-binding protein [Aurantimonas sp. CSK15Z-1]MCQ8783327.1 ATP-binding protein [Aurantimonas sp. CSK15Z-1]
MSFVMTMAESASIILLAVLFLAFVRARFAERFWLSGLLLGIVFALVGAMVMQNPVEIVPGIRTDPRSAVVALAAAFGGPLSAAITAAALSSLRLYFGGLGAWSGAYSIWGMAVASAALWYWWRRLRGWDIDPHYVALQAVLAGVVPTLVLWVTTKASMETFALSASLFVPTNMIAVYLLGTLLLRDQERRMALAAHRDAEARLQAIANNAPAVLFQMVRDPAGAPIFTFLSRGTNRIFGIDPAEVLASPTLFTEMLSHQGATSITEQLATSAETLEAWSLDVECVRSDSGIVWLRFAAEPRIDAGGELVWDGTATDVTAQKRSEQMKDEFISVVSHELRTPLTSIRGSLGLLTSGAAGQLPPRAANLTAIAHSNSERLVLLVNDILDMEKIRSGKMELSIRPEPLRALLEQAIRGNKDYLPEKGVKLVLLDDAHDVKVMVDPDRLQQVLSNLLSNAVKFAPEGSTVTVAAALAGTMVRISVTDEGPGIPEEFRSRIFGRFEQAESSSTRRSGGTGLGLNISRAIVERMAGVIDFACPPAGGTVFFIDLPMRRSTVAERPADRSPEARADCPRVLICGADREISAIVGEALRTAGLCSDAAPDLDTSRELLATRDYSAMVLDTALIKTAGASFFDEIRLGARTRDLPIIVIEGEADGAQSLRGHMTDIVDWLAKPVDAERFGAAIGKALGQTQRKRPRILHVEDDESVLKVLAETMDGKVAVTFARSLAEARASLATASFGVVVLDLQLPDGSGLDLLDDIPPETPVIVFSAFDVGPEVTARVGTVITKSRMREIDVAEAVLAALPPPAGDTDAPLQLTA